MGIEKNFAEVVNEIKDDEIWYTDNTEITKNDDGALIIKHKNYIKNTDINVVGPEFLAINLNAKYKVKKRYDNV